MFVYITKGCKENKDMSNFIKEIAYISRYMSIREVFD